MVDLLDLTVIITTVINTIIMIVIIVERTAEINGDGAFWVLKQFERRSIMKIKGSVALVTGANGGIGARQRFI
jgi:hypothetical protein